jgi:predicted Ser/Thr protein kinase
MTDALHGRASEILARALELPAERRVAFVCEACGGDARLRDEVLDLLGHSREDSFLAPDGTLAGRLRVVANDSTEGGDPVAVDGYRILGRIGAGGMGVVYRALQGAPRRVVALKVMRRFAGSDSAVRRFQHEAELLARLEHPGIARIIAAGLSTGVDPPSPYIAMEFVDGTPITESARGARGSTKDRVELFLKVCAAVEHAHQQGVIHRDLKPQNILVDRAGNPKVIDFGVARATNGDLLLSSMHTKAGDLIGTMQYMSPEQCSGDARAVDTRCDVYALGVILHELLCGRLPYDLADATLPQAIETIRSIVPPDPRRFASGLPADLAAILRKTLEKDRQCRYASAGALGDDLRRHLAGEPVTARSPSGLVRVVRWATRHPRSATAGACSMILAVSLVATFVSVEWLTRIPARVVVDREQRGWVVESRAGAVLARFDGSQNGAVEAAELIDLPHELGGGTAVAVAYSGLASPDVAGTLCLHDATPSAKLRWSSRVDDEDLPKGERARPASGFSVERLVPAEVFDDPTGVELIVTCRLDKFSACLLRVLDLRGHVRYEAWHDGSITSVQWLAGARSIVATAPNSEHSWSSRGQEVRRSEYPLAVFAVRPRDGRTGTRNWIVRDGRVLDETLLWYRWLGPAEDVIALGATEMRLSNDTGRFDRANHFLLDVVTARPELGMRPATLLRYVLDGDGIVRASWPNEDYRTLAAKAPVPPFDRFSLLDLARMPAAR